MSAVTCVAIGFMAIALTLQRKLQKNYQNLFAVIVEKRGRPNNCIVVAASHMMNRNFIFVAISARTGSMVVVLVYCKAKLSLLMNMFARSVREIPMPMQLI